MNVSLDVGRLKTAVLNLWVATPAGVALGFPRGRLEPHEFVKKVILSKLIFTYFFIL